MFRCSRGIVAIGAVAVLAFGLSPAKADKGGHIPLCPQNIRFTATPGTAANPYFPLTSALEGTLVGPDADGTIHGLQIKLGGFEMVGSVRTRIVEELEWHETTVDGLHDDTERLIEDSFNYFAQSRDDKTVCYFGEFVYNYNENGVLLPDDHHGSWRADAAPLPANCDIIDPAQPNLPGIQMLANPKQQGARYQQESATCAKDVAQIASFGDTVMLNGTPYSDVIRTKEGSLIETGAKEYKAYAPGKGLVIDDTLERCTPSVSCSDSVASLRR